MRIRPRNKSHLVKPRNLQQQTRSLSLSLFLRCQGFQGSQKHISLSSFFCPVWWPRKKKEIRGKKRAGHAQTDVRASLSQSVDVLLVGEKDLQVVFRPTWNCVAESAAVDKISERERERRPFFLRWELFPSTPFDQVFPLVESNVSVQMSPPLWRVLSIIATTYKWPNILSPLLPSPS